MTSLPRGLIILGYDAVWIGNPFLMFQRHCNPSKCWETIIQWCNIISQNNVILSHTSVKTSGWNTCPTASGNYFSWLIFVCKEHSLNRCHLNIPHKFSSYLPLQVSCIACVDHLVAQDILYLDLQTTEHNPSSHQVLCSMDISNLKWFCHVLWSVLPELHLSGKRWSL